MEDEGSGGPTLCGPLGGNGGRESFVGRPSITFEGPGGLEATATLYDAAITAISVDPESSPQQALDTIAALRGRV